MAKILERIFGAVGKVVVKYPWVSIILSFVLTLGIGSGFFVALETENRPDQLWVPSTAVALDHTKYTSDVWPAGQRFDFWIATCKEEGCNMLSADVQGRLSAIHEKIMAIEIDGSALRSTQSSYGDIEKEEWEAQYAGNWSFEQKQSSQAKCFKFGPFCGQSSILDVFKMDPAVIGDLTDETALAAINFWETQKTLCPVSIATAGSPCVDTSVYLPAASPTDCQEYNTTTQKQNCRASSENYCADVCPTVCTVIPGVESCVPMAQPGTTCKDEGCITLEAFGNLGNSSNSSGAPDSAFAFEPFKISTVASSGADGPKLAESGEVASAEALFGYYALSVNQILIGGAEVDPVADAWEAEALCVLGIQVPDSEQECPGDDVIMFNPQFSRSLPDEFGTTISGDVPLLAAAIMGIVVYMAIMLSRRDSVYASLGMSIVVLLIVGLSWIGGMGLGAWIGLMNNNLNNNIPFLLLGLGVDDAFVLAGEFLRAQKMNPKGTAEDWAVDAARFGGVSILITSLTDALAFLVGSMTVLPALGWFCAFAGMGIIFCFIMQITVLLPALVINQRRVDANRFDFLCCFKSKVEHDYDHPNGCCGLCCKSTPTDVLPGLMTKFAKAIVKPKMVVFTFLLFGGLLTAGIVGTTRIYKDFKLEWFVPDNSYLQDFYSLNDEYFAAGVPANVYVKDIDYFSSQTNLTSLHTYLTTTQYVDQSAAIDDWFEAFLQDSVADTEVQPKLVDGNSRFGAETDLYTALWDWYRLGGGVRFRNSIQWVDANCNFEPDWDNCAPASGLNATRFGFTLAKNETTLGQDRYDTMTAMRERVKEIFPPRDGVEMAFPYSFQFLYWEEVGVIDVELGRNLAICGGIILGIIFVLIPKLRVAPLVVFCIVSAIVEVIGFLHWWGNVTISGVSTIYILICVGLAVDYSAHIAHMFVISVGSSKERAISAMTRIGPSTFNAVASTMVAVIVLAASQSYVFRVFFKALFLVVVLGGANGMWLLPVLLSLLGGSKDGKALEADGKEMTSVVATPSGPGSMEKKPSTANRESNGYITTL